MKLFVSYASEDREDAEQITLALRTAGHLVFFDRDQLSPGESYIEKIRLQIEGSDCMIFLISPKSVEVGSYCLSELNIAQRQWPNPARHVLPVMIRKTDWGGIPPYLGAVTVLEPRGSVPAEVEAAISKVKPRYPRYLSWLGLFMVMGGSAFGTLNLVGVYTRAWTFVGTRWLLVPTATFLCVLIGMLGAATLWSGQGSGGDDKETAGKHRRRWGVLVFLAVFALMSIATSVLASRYYHVPPDEDLYVPSLGERKAEKRP